MSDNIKSAIKEIKIDKRLSDETKQQARELDKIVGSNKPIPDPLKNDILKNKSKSDSVVRMKNYVKNKK